MISGARHPRAIVALIVVAVAAIAAVGVLESGPEVQSATAIRSEVSAEYATHLSNIHSMNISAIEEDYTSGATVQFADGTQQTGNYTGLRGIADAYGADVFPNFALPRFSNLNSSIEVTGKSARLNSTFLMQGYNMDGSPLTAWVNLRATYVDAGGTWLISQETWYFASPTSSPP